MSMHGQRCIGGISDLSNSKRSAKPFTKHLARKLIFQNGLFLDLGIGPAAIEDSIQRASPFVASRNVGEGDRRRSPKPLGRPVCKAGEGSRIQRVQSVKFCATNLGRGIDPRMQGQPDLRRYSYSSRAVFYGDDSPVWQEFRGRRRLAASDAKKHMTQIRLSPAFFWLLINWFF